MIQEFSFDRWQNRFFLTIKVTCVAMLLALPAQGLADLIPVVPVSATTTMGNGASLSTTIDGSGMDVWPSVAGVHATTNSTNSWVSAGTTTGTIDFDLGAVKSICGLSFWNQNNNPAPYTAATGIKDLNVLSSLDGSTFTAFTGSPTLFAQETGFSSSAQVFTWAPINARYFRFDVLSNWGDGSQTGFAENFFLTNIPEPTSFAMFGVACMVMTRRRRR